VVKRTEQTGTHRTASCRGFTMVEVLVAVIVLSVGLLGLAGLQAASLRNNQQSYMRSQSILLVNDIAERMRANLPGVQSGAYNQSAGAAPMPNINCSNTTGCSSAELASNDLAEWTTDVGNTLPAGEAFICLDSTPDDGTGAGNPQCDGAGPLYAIKLWWDDTRSGNTTRFATSFQP